MRDLVQWLSGTGLSHAIQEAIWLIALMQIIHILAVAAILSSVAVAGLRIARAPTVATVRAARARFLPWIWWSLLALLLSGLVQIIAEPARTLVDNPSFELKMALLIVAVAALLIGGARARADEEPGADASPAAARLWATGAFALWCAIAIAGRWIAYTQAE